MDKNIVCYYHDKCLDGMGAAFAVYTKYGSACEYIPATYGMDLDIKSLEGKIVYVVDFSFSLETMLAIKDVAVSLILLDHHKSAAETLNGYFEVDQSKSGAVLTWEHLFPETAVPQILLHIQDRDLWQWKLEGTKAITAYIYMTCKTPEEFNPLAQDTLVDKNKLEEIRKLGQIIVDYQEAEITATLPNRRRIAVAGHSILIVNCPTSLSSEIGNRLAVESGTFGMTYSDVNGKRMFSLRSLDDQVDVSEIAVMFGGGGHRNAAGMSMLIDDPRLDNFVKEISMNWK